MWTLGDYGVFESRYQHVYAVRHQLADTHNTVHSYTFTQSTCNQSIILWPFFLVHLGEPVLSQRTDLLEQPLDFYEPDVLPAIQFVMSKHCKKNQWLSRLLFYKHGIISTPCLTNSVKALKEEHMKAVQNVVFQYSVHLS